MAPFTNTEACSHPIFHLLAKKMSQFACPHASFPPSSPSITVACPMPHSRRVPALHRRSDPVPGHRRSTGGCSQATGDRHATLRRRPATGSDPWGTVPSIDLPPIDRLEGFRPGGHSMYQRVMVAAARGSIACAVWTYTMHAPQNGERITNDNQAVFWKSRLYSAQNA